MKIKNLQKYGLMFLIVTYCLSTGCGGATDYDPMEQTNESISADSMMGINSSYKDAYDDSYVEDYESAEQDKSSVVLREDKLVYTSDITIETKKFNDTYSYIKTLVSDYNGVIEVERLRDNDHNWYAEDYVDNPTMRCSFILRIPSEKYKDFLSNLNSMDEDTKIIEQENKMENITQSYFDLEIRIDSLESEYERLSTLLSQADDINEILEIEKALSECIYKLDSAKANLRNMDMQVSYSTVNIELEEVSVLSTYRDETTFFGRIAEGFKDAFETGVELLEELIIGLFNLIPITLFVIIPSIAFLKLVLYLFERIFKIKLKNVIKHKDRNKNS